MDSEVKSDEMFVIDAKPSFSENRQFKCDSDEGNRSHKRFSKKRRLNESTSFENNPHKHNKLKKTDDDGEIKAAIVYYENVLKDLKKGIDIEIKDEIICNVLKESEGKEVVLACHGLVSHCFEILLSQCQDISILQRFMMAFERNKVPVCTSANASHLTELLIHAATKALQNWTVVINSEDCEQKDFVLYCFTWLEAFGTFALESLDDCLHSSFSCHVICTLIGALAGDLAGNKELMSKNLKNHKKQFQSQFNEIDSSKNIQEHNSNVVLETIPKSFSSLLKTFYKTLIQSEYLINYINDSSSATVIEALLFALKKRCPKACKKMIKKIVKKMFMKRNQDNVPLSLFHKNASYVFDEIFKVADEDLQLTIFNDYISDHIGSLVVDPIGNFVVQRLFDTVNSKSLFEIMCKCMWCLFDKIAESQNFGIFVSMSSACNRLNAQQAMFMENIMKCLQCFEPVERQDLVIPIILGLQKYDDFIAEKKSKTDLKVCLQGSLLAQAILKFQKPLKAVKSIQSMSPEEIEFLAGHIQGCHVLNTYFGSNTVGDKNKEKLLQHLEPVLISMACDRNKSLTLSRIWTYLPLKLKEIVARHLAQQQYSLKSSKSGYAIFHKFGIPRFRKLQEWRQMQSNISSIKKV